ncbi:MAG: glycine/betaine/sarcosine/D-proline family reductase selenoprotein B, partial [Acidimicrobiales bacterium]
MKIVHYLNQFFAGVGGEEEASLTPQVREGPTGPGRKLAALLPEGFEIVATVYCGDDYAASAASAAGEIFGLARAAGAEMLVAGPAFSSGRYGIACARVAAAAARAGILSLGALHTDNPGVPEAGTAPLVATGPTAKEMAAALELLARAVTKMAAGDPLTASDGAMEAIAKPRRNRLDEKNAAERAVDLVLARLAGDAGATEIGRPDFTHVTPAGALPDPSRAVVALLTEGALVPAGNPDRLESARARKWLRYPLPKGLLAPGDYVSVHGGFSTVAANSDPHR